MDKLNWNDLSDRSPISSNICLKISINFNKPSNVIFSTIFQLYTKGNDCIILLKTSKASFILYTNIR